MLCRRVLQRIPLPSASTLQHTAAISARCSRRQIHATANTRTSAATCPFTKTISSSEAALNTQGKQTQTETTPSPAASVPLTPPSPPLLSPRYGLPVRASLPEYTWEEVYAHCTASSYWIVIDSHIYDIASYANHPGGGIDKLFSRAHGTDVGEAFAETHAWNEKRATLRYLVGKIKEGSVTNRVAKPRPVIQLVEEEEEEEEEEATTTTTAVAHDK